ncbi:hypothetical protein KQH82_12090 [bacterium]|nr:hypothetical protein [bacterium]
MDKNELNKYAVLQSLALAGVSGEDYLAAVQTALGRAARLVGLNAAALYLWDEEMNVTLQGVFAESEEHRKRLAQLETDLFVDLRQKQRLLSAYLTFDGVPQVHTFTMPLRHRTRVFGAVIGLQEGERTVIAEDLFLEALAASMALNALASDIAGQAAGTQDRIDAERLGAIIETAVTVNHEINNPLTAILGNIQLLLMKKEDLDEETARKLRVVEQSALKIRDVTQRLLKITNARSVTYIEGTNMLHLPEDESDTDKESGE